MTRRHVDEAESRASAGPLFEAAEKRAVQGMTRAAHKAERVMEGWRANAVEAVRLYARTHETFLAEDVRAIMPEPDRADGRAWGAVMRDAVRAGYIEAGYATRDKWGSWKTLWRSLVR